VARRAWILGLVVLAVVVIGAALLIGGYRNAPLRQTTGRTCIGCISIHWNGTSRVRASRLSVDYAFRRDVSYRIDFADGSVLLDGRRLAPGCHEGRAQEGDTLELDAARDVRIRVPAPPEGCPDGAGPSSEAGDGPSPPAAHEARPARLERGGTNG
jgi:hypothetical protein